MSWPVFSRHMLKEPIALTATMVIPSLLLQKPHCSSKTRDHITCLERRLQLWKAGDINSLILEGRTIQCRLPQYSSPPHNNNQNLSRNFSKLMMSGKTKAALHLLSDQYKSRVLHLNDSANIGEQRVCLSPKHPAGQPALPETLIQNHESTTIHPILFESIDASTIRSAALHTNGAAGPSGLDAHAWRRLCTSFHSASNDLCHSLAKLAK